MKKRITNRFLAASAVVLFAFTGVNAQVANPDYSEYDANVLVPTNTEFVTLNAGGTVMGYYALPDPVYHPTYAGPLWPLTAGFTWAWTAPTQPAPGTATITYPVATFPANYGRVTYAATGNYVVNVAETAPAAFGSCADATPTVMNVTVIAPPSATLTTADPAAACGDQAALTVDVQFTEAIADALASYSFAVNELVENIDVSNTVTATLTDNDGYIDYPTVGKLTGLTGGAWQFPTSALNVQNNLRTRYTYTLIKSASAPGPAADGIISAISQKSDYVFGTVRTHAFNANNSIVIIVNPAPSTGPIYHIANNFAL